MDLIRPTFLKKNDKVALIATAKSFDRLEMDAFIKTIKSWDLQLVEGKNLYKKYNQFAGTDEERAADLQEAIDNENIKAIFCARGGYGTARIIDSINFAALSEKPKWIIGFSDITLLHSHLTNLGYQSMHATMPILFGKAGYAHSENSLRETLFGKTLSLELEVHPLNRVGSATGMLSGGNLTMLHTSINTASGMDFSNKILFIEDVGEYLYHLDRMMVHFKRTGALTNLKGLLVGHFSGMKDNDLPFGNNAYEIIFDAVKEYSYPIIFGFPVGHEPDNLPLICGSIGKLEVTTEGASFSHLPYNGDVVI